MCYSIGELWNRSTNLQINLWYLLIRKLWLWACYLGAVQSIFIYELELNRTILFFQLSDMFYDTFIAQNPVHSMINQILCMNKHWGSCWRNKRSWRSTFWLFLENYVPTRCFEGTFFPSWLGKTTFYILQYMLCSIFTNE